MTWEGSDQPLVRLKGARMGHPKSVGIRAIRVIALLLLFFCVATGRAAATVSGVQIQVTPDASMLTTDAVFTNRVVWRSPTLDVRTVDGDTPQDIVLTDGDVFQIQVVFPQPLAVALTDPVSNGLEGIKFEIFGSAPNPDPAADVDYLWLFGGVEGGPLALSAGQPVMTGPITGNFDSLGFPTRIINRNLDLVIGGNPAGVVSFDSILLTLTYHGPGAWTFDRARFTVAADEVAIVPEPAVGVLLPIMIAMGFKRPRRSGPTPAPVRLAA